ncbi:MAG: response regulator transcription factor [Muribaculaceae bacterium]|nr:response regulator transcription factor [Muribaculaceae bacterium]
MAERQTVLVVDDERTLCDVLKLNLELDGYCVDVAYSAEEALKMPLYKYSLILLDVMMEEMSGFEFTSAIRADEKLKNIPVILCTAKDTENDLVNGFMCGADDYIKKPFSMKELLLRVKSVLRRSCVGQQLDKANQLITYKTLEIDLEKKECYIDGEEIPFTKKELGILKLLLSNCGKVFSREEILNEVWDEDVYVVDRTIDVNINRLRKKLGKYGNNIITKQGYGYGFKNE